MKLLFLDCETTGLDPKTNSIFQLSGKIKDETGEEEFNYFMRPYKGDTISEIASQKTGKTQEELEAYPDQLEAYNSFIDLLNRHDVGVTYKDKAFLVGYNASFDSDHLRQWFADNENDKYGYKIFSPPLDVMHMANLYLAPRRHMMRNFQLTTVYETIFNESFENSHDSRADIVATEKLFYFLSGKMLKDLVKRQSENTEAEQPL